MRANKKKCQRCRLPCCVPVYRLHDSEVRLGCTVVGGGNQFTSKKLGSSATYLYYLPGGMIGPHGRPVNRGVSSVYSPVTEAAIPFIAFIYMYTKFDASRRGKNMLSFSRDNKVGAHRT